MALRGNLRDFTVTQLLNLINLAQKTGTLVVDGPGEQAHVSFREGKLAYARVGQDDGSLAAVLHKANKLTDTGLHSKGWTREQVLEYMDANSSAAEARRVSETERYMAIPDQALAYKIGQLKLSELRARAEKELGPRFDIRRFHTAVLIDGGLPLDVLEAKIDRWIASQR